MLVEATVKLDEQVKKIGRAVDDSKPYWEARKVARQVNTQTHTHVRRRELESLGSADSECEGKISEDLRREVERALLLSN